MRVKHVKLSEQTTRVWKIILIIVLVPALVIAYSKVFSQGCSGGGGAEGKLGERVTSKLSMSLNREGQMLEFEPHGVRISDYNIEEGWVNIGILCYFKNVGKRDLTLHFKDDLRVEDQDGRRFSTERRHTFRRWSATISPGFEQEEYFHFKLPAGAFSGDLYLGFPEEGDGVGKMLAKMKIYDARLSDFSIGDSGSFYSVDWSADK